MKVKILPAIGLLFILVASFTMACCVPGKIEPPSKEIRSVKIDGSNYIYVVEIDRCEYLIYDGDKAGAMIHKTNCKNHFN